MTASNDRVVLNGLLEAGNRARMDLDESQYFEYFCHRQILKQFDPSDDELAFGLTDGSNDGGIDGWFTFVNSELIDETFNPSLVRGPNPRLDVHITQTKTSDGFKEDPLLTLGASLRDLLQLDDRPDLSRRYNTDILARSDEFRSAYIGLLAQYPELFITLTYATRGDSRTVSAGVRARADDLERQIKELFPGATVAVTFMGARRLVELSRTEPTAPLRLQFRETPITTRDNAYVALVRIKDYATFVTDEAGELRRYLFDSNVRDYQGEVAVNREIRASLEGSDGVDFWWLNNGVTILASRGNMSGKTLTISDVQIVNGLQSTNVIFDFFAGHAAEPEDDRSVLVKVIITEDDDARNQIIRATNLQTAIPPASFRASEQLQRDIDDFFYSQGWFYDRRKNHYRNLGHPPARIVGITYLAQSFAAIVLQEPDAARGAVSALVRDDKNYHRIFNDVSSPELYLFVAKTMRGLDQLVPRLQDWPLESRRKFRYHAATILVAQQLPKPQFPPLDLRSLLNRVFDSDDVKRAYSEVLEAFNDFNRTTGQSVDPASKSRAFTRHLLSRGGYARIDSVSGAKGSGSKLPRQARSRGVEPRKYLRRTSTLDELLQRADHLGVSSAIRAFVQRGVGWGLHQRVHFYCVNLNAPENKSVGLVIVSPAGERPGLIHVEVAAKSFHRFYPAKTEAEYREHLGPSHQWMTPAELESFGDRVERLLAEVRKQAR